jgi:hypothetical protein
MAKLTDLVLRSSDVTGVPVATVREVSRRLREAALIRTGTGGRYGGADMTPIDAAGLLTALLIVRASSISLSDIVRLTRSHLKDFRSHSFQSERFVLDRWDRRLGLPQLCRLRRGHTFGDSFSALIGSISTGDLERAIANWARSRPQGAAPFFGVAVKINSPRPHAEARIEFNSPALGESQLIYLRPRDATKLIEPRLPRKWSEVSDDARFDLTVTATVNTETLKSIGLLLKNTETEHA